MFDEKDRESFYRIIQSRRSVRSYLEDEVPEESLMRILETGRRAASAANCQPWYFLVARRRDDHPLYKLLRGRSFEKAPVVILGLADRERAWVRKWDGANYARVDLSIALTEMILAATAEGLGTCWIAAFDPAEARRLLNIPPGLDPVSMFSLGYPAEPLKEEEKDRRSMDDILRRGLWS